MTVRFIKPDHLIVVAARLEDGIAHVAESLQTEPVVIGESFAPQVSPNTAGTAESAPGANREASGSSGSSRARLALWNGLYIDVVVPGARSAATGSMAADAHDGPPGFGSFNSQAMRLRAAHGPFLAHWVARVERPRRLAAWAAQYPRRIAPVASIRYGNRFASAAVDPAGALPAWRGAGDGLLPTLVQWDDLAHPAASLPETRIALKALRGFHPAPELIDDQLRWLGLDTMLTVESTAVEPSLMAEFDTPRGPRTLR